MSFYKNKLKKYALLFVICVVPLTAQTASAVCTKTGYIEFYGNAITNEVYLREVAGSGNVWYMSLDITDPVDVNMGVLAANAATSGAKVRIQGDAASCPSASPFGYKNMGNATWFQIGVF